MTKAELWETQIKPLLEKVCKLCEDNDIPLVLGAMLDENRVQSMQAGIVSMYVMSTMPEKDDWAVPDKLKDAYHILWEEVPHKNSGSMN